MARRTKFGALIAILVLIITVAGCRSKDAATGHLAPPVSFKLIDGQVATISQYAGRVLLVDFWATTCAICLAEMPSMHEIADSMAAQGLSIVTVTMRYDRPDHVLNAVQKRAIKLPVALDIQGEVASALGPVNGTPTRVIIDRSGRIVERMVGAIKPAQLRARLRALLGEPA